jgi:hypothetical protein
MERLTAFDEEQKIQQLPLHRFWRGLDFCPQCLRHIAHRCERIPNSSREQPANLAQRFHGIHATGWLAKFSRAGTREDEVDGHRARPG